MLIVIVMFVLLPAWRINFFNNKVISKCCSITANATIRPMDHKSHGTATLQCRIRRTCVMSHQFFDE